MPAQLPADEQSQPVKTPLAHTLRARLAQSLRHARDYIVHRPRRTVLYLAVSLLLGYWIWAYHQRLNLMEQQALSRMATLPPQRPEQWRWYAESMCNGSLALRQARTSRLFASTEAAMLEHLYRLQSLELDLLERSEHAADDRLWDELNSAHAVVSLFSSEAERTLNLYSGGQ